MERRSTILYAIISSTIVILALCAVSRRPMHAESKTAKKAPAPAAAAMVESTEPTRTVVVDPDVRRLMDLERAVVDGGGGDDDGQALITMGDAYRAGAYPRYLPDERSAEDCYRAAAECCPSGEVAGLAQARLVDLRMHPLDDLDRAGTRHLPPEHATRACDAIRRRARSLPTWAWTRPRFPKLPIPDRREDATTVDDVEDAEDQHWTRTIDRILWETRGRAGQTTTTMTTPAAPRRQRWEDAQNVHDHGVVRSVRDRLRRYRREDKDIDHEKAWRQVRARSAASKEACDVLDSLSSLENGSVGASERGALAIVWDAIQRQTDATKRNDLEDALVLQLASGVEHGHVVCSSGKIARVAAALDGIEVDVPENNIVPMWAVREEIYSMAAKVRDEHEEASVDDMKRVLRERVERAYVSGGPRLSPSVLEPIIATCEEAF